MAIANTPHRTAIELDEGAKKRLVQCLKDRTVSHSELRRRFGVSLTRLTSLAKECGIDTKPASKQRGEAGLSLAATIGLARIFHAEKPVSRVRYGTHDGTDPRLWSCEWRLWTLDRKTVEQLTKLGFLSKGEQERTITETGRTLGADLVAKGWLAR